MRRENVNSDIEITVRFLVGGVQVPVPAHDFCLRFRTAGHYGTYFDCKQEKGVLKHCDILAAGTLLKCNLNGHGLSVGTLTCEYYDYIPSPDFADGTRKVVAPCGMDVDLTNTVGGGSTDVPLDVALELKSWIESEVYGAPEMRTMNADFRFEDKYIMNSSQGISGEIGNDGENGNYELLVFKVEEGEHWHVRREATSNETGGILCALYTSENASDIAFANIVDGSKGSTLNDEGVVEKEYDSIPEGAKWLAVTRYKRYSSELTTVKKLSYINPIERINTFSDELDVRMNALELENKYDNFVALGDDRLIGRRDDHVLTNGSSSTPRNKVTYETGERKFFFVKGWSVTPGEMLRIDYDINASASYASVYGFFAPSTLEDFLTEDVDTVPDISALYVGEPRHFGQYSGQDIVEVPQGAGILIVSFLKSGPAKIAPFINSPILLKTKIAELESEISSAANNRLQAVRAGEDIYVFYNRGDGVDIVYHFGRVFTTTNNTMGLRRVGYRAHSDTLTWTNDITTLDNQSTSDMLGPVAIDSNNWVGGAHLVNGISTSSTQSWTITCNGVALNNGERKSGSYVEMSVLNKSSHPSWGDVLDEEIKMRVLGDKLEVHVKHSYNYSGAVGKTITTYYGMQSNGFASYASSYVRTPHGAHPVWTLISHAQSFKKGDYPEFGTFELLQPSTGWREICSLDTSPYGRRDGVDYIGDHSYLADGEREWTGVELISGGSAKRYHTMILNKVITSGMAYEWRGMYQWTDKFYD